MQGLDTSHQSRHCFRTSSNYAEAVDEQEAKSDDDFGSESETSSNMHGLLETTLDIVRGRDKLIAAVSLQRQNTFMLVISHSEAQSVVVGIEHISA